MLKHGISMKQIQEWLGHSNFATTANIYSHLDYSSKITSAEKINEILNFSAEKKMYKKGERFVLILRSVLKKFIRFKKTRSCIT